MKVWRIGRFLSLLALYLTLWTLWTSAMQAHRIVVSFNL